MTNARVAISGRKPAEIFIEPAGVAGFHWIGSKLLGAERHIERIATSCFHGWDFEPRLVSMIRQPPVTSVDCKTIRMPIHIERGNR